jgi:ribA/ribD-fused uncharacterized protein
MSKINDMDYYLESISIFYDEKLKFLSTKDNFLKCKDCPTKKIFKEGFEEISLSCGGKDGDDKCGMKIIIKFPKYIHYEKDMNLLKNELETGLNLEKINEYIDVSENLKEDTKKRKQIEGKMKEITDKFYKINVQNKKNDIENFYRSRVDKTKRCREILRDINQLEESEREFLRKEYISLNKTLNSEYIQIKELVETFQPFHMVKKPEVSLRMDVESGKKKIKKKIKKKLKQEKSPVFTKGAIVHWEFKGEIITGFVKTEKEVGGMLKIVSDEGKTFYIPKGKLNIGEHEPEPEPEEVEEKPIEEEPVEEIKGEKNKLIMNIFSLFKENNGIITREKYLELIEKTGYKTQWDKTLFIHLQKHTPKPWKKKEQQQHGSIIKDPKKKDPDYIELTKKWMELLDVNINEEKQERLYFNHSKQNKWLSTFNKAEPFKYNGMEYPMVEHAFHAQKVSDDNPRVEEYRTALSSNVNDILTPSAAKKFGGKDFFKENDFTLRNDWDDVKLKIMEEIIRDYYISNKDLIDKLIETDNKLLVHKGFGINTFWGVDKNNEGRNNQGNILMKLREEFKNA